MKHIGMTVRVGDLIRMFSTVLLFIYFRMTYHFKSLVGTSVTQMSGTNLHPPVYSLRSANINLLCFFSFF